ncbi:class I SAM-dependent methyltransferase [Bacillus salitolerans]|uniref:Class I SAM-dependent methyltransferase n=1 Tax=Bacillus salitolerans TaxID=1437434 RepID=A0ABW4LZB6_9BACI
MKEQDYDQLLNIQTAGEQNGFYSSYHYHRYEPTPYRALELLFEQYKLTSDDYIVDFGCGKGRLAFYIHYFFHATVKGIEMIEDYYHDALVNLESYFANKKRRDGDVQFYHCFAEEYPIAPLDNRFYFFNPFSIQIFMKTINHILVSIEQIPRTVELILYYVSDEYLFYLENCTLFELKQEVVIPEMKDSNERFLIYRLVG